MENKYKANPITEFPSECNRSNKNDPNRNIKGLELVTNFWVSHPSRYVSKAPESAIIVSMVVTCYHVISR